MQTESDDPRTAPEALTPAADADPLLRTIGHTPLIPLRRIVAEGAGVRVFLKAEWFNPGGSVKDRAAYRMLRAAEQCGQLTPDKVIIDATSGNTGIAYAMIAARRGYCCRLLMPANASRERQQLLKAYGAHLILTDPVEGSDGAYFEVQQYLHEQPGLYFYPDQYSNPENPQAHYATTGPELIEQTRGEITHFIAGVGTSGTLLGTGRRLREFNPRIRIVAVQPDGPLHGLEGLKHMATAKHVPALYDANFPDQTLAVASEDAQAMCRRLCNTEGLCVGVSAGAAVAAAVTLAATLERGTIVAIGPDGGSRYQSESFWEDK